MFVRFFVGALLLMSAGLRPLAAQPADTLRLNVASAMAKALAVSPEVRQVDAEWAFAQAQNRQARASRILPQLELSTAHAPAPQLTASTFPTDQLYLDPNLRNDWSNLSVFNQVEVKFAQPIYTWKELSGTLEASRFGMTLAEAKVAEKTVAVAFRAAELYYNLLLTRALLSLAEETGNIVEQAEREVSRLLEEGAAGVDDADLFEVQLVQQEYIRRLAEVMQAEQIAEMALIRQLFLPESTVLQAEALTLEPLNFTVDSLAVYQTLALQHRPEHAQAEAGLAARSALVDVARSDYYPKLFIGGAAKWATTPGRFNQPNPYISDGLRGRSVQVGLSVRQKLNFGETRARVQQAEAQRDQVRYQAEALNQLILFEVEEAYRQLLIAETALQAQEASLQISKEWLRTEQINFDLDLGDTENLVRAVRTNLDLQAGYYTTVHRYNVAVLRLLRTSGLLVDWAENHMQN